MPLIELSPDRLLAAEAQLPMAANIFSRLSFQLANPKTALEDVAETVMLDTALAARVIRVANSPVYRRGDPVVSLNQAITYIGTQQTCQIVGLLVSDRVFVADLPHYGVASEDVWASSVTSAIAARILAARIGCNEGEAYTLALLRGMGRLLLQRLAVEDAVPSERESLKDASSVRQWELRTFGVDAMEATIRVLQSWNFPNEFIVVLRRLQRHQIIGPETAALYLANVVAERAGAGIAIEKGLWTVDAPLLRAAGLDNVALHDVMQAAKQEASRLKVALA